MRQPTFGAIGCSTVGSPIRRSAVCGLILLFGVIGVVAGPVAASEPLQKFEQCQLIDETWADGDSFHVRFPEVVHGARDHVVRLYFVDCPESAARRGSDVDRLREQSRYFGIQDPLTTLAMGKEAKIFVKEALSAPFTVWTRFAGAMGRAAKPRIFGIVLTAQQKSLDELLVRRGLARNRGVRTGLPDGTTIEQHRDRLDGLQTEAIMKSAGVWHHSDPTAIVAGREFTLEEERKRRKIIETASSKGELSGLRVDPNRASPDQLQQLPRIGPALANRIIENRPYQRVEDLRRVPGIGDKTLQRLRQYLEFGEAGE